MSVAYETGPRARIVHTLNPRRNRDFERGRRAAVKARLAGDGAMDAALAQIGDTFNHAATVNAFKMRVEHMIRLGADHPAVRARFGARAAMLSDILSSGARSPGGGDAPGPSTLAATTIASASASRRGEPLNSGAHSEVRRRNGQPVNQAIAAVERWYRAERKAYQIAIALLRPSAITVEILSELRLILRLMRCTGNGGEFGYVLGVVLGTEP